MLLKKFERFYEPNPKLEKTKLVKLADVEFRIYTFEKLKNILEHHIQIRRLNEFLERPIPTIN